MRALRLCVTNTSHSRPMPNKTVYITDADEPFWIEAQRMLPFYQRKSISAFVIEKVREYVKEENARQSQRTKGSDSGQ
jgi:hypothetical protein